MIINMNGAKAPETPSPVLQEKTVTPETLPTVIGADEGYDGLSQVTVNPDAQLKAENIRSGKTIFGVSGVFEGVNTGNALTPEALINECHPFSNLRYGCIKHIPFNTITYVKDEVTDTETKFKSSAGMSVFEGVQIGDYRTPLADKLNYNVCYFNAFPRKTFYQMTGSSSTTGKVTGSLFGLEYTGAPIYQSFPISEFMRYPGQEYGVYEADMHVAGYALITDAPNSPYSYIADLDFPKFFEGDIHVKYSSASDSTKSGILDITGLPVFSVENYPVGNMYGEKTTYYLQFLIEKLWLLNTPVKTGEPIV